MAKLLSLDAYIANSSNHENVESLGKWVFGVCVDTGISAMSTRNQIPEDEYDYFKNGVDDIISFGGPMQSMGTNDQSDNIKTISHYIPLVTERKISSSYNSSDYELKLVNSRGDYAVKVLDESSSIAMYHLYTASGTLITDIALSGNTYSLDNDNVSWGGFVVSEFGDDGLFTKNAAYYGVSLNSNRYWDVYQISSYNDDIVIDFLNNITIYEVPTDPYINGGASGTGGGTGDFDGTSEDIGIPGLPSISAADTGFISLFNPSAGELKNLANYMWGDMFDISTWKKIFADPMDAILGLSIVPVNVPSRGSATVTIGNISTGISMTKASSQYVSVDCGTINVNEYWGAYLDYSPYTQAEIYLPFIGIHPLTIDDIMGKPVHVVYHVDVLSGACCAYVQCGGTVLYSFVGQCSCSIPITANDWTNVINGALSIAGAIGSMVASGGATAPMAVTNIASTAVNSLKPNVEKSGSMGGMGGMLGVQKPYIILTRPRQALPEKQNTFTGYPAFITKKLSECTGYTEVESIHLENVPATQNELDEITELLKSGVII